MFRPLALAVMIAPLTSFIADGEKKPVVSDQIKVEIVEPKDPIQVQFKDKVKVRIEVKQPDGVQPADLVLIVLGKGKLRYSDWATKRTGISINPYEYEFEFSMPGVKEDCDLFATSIYVTSPRPGHEKREVIRVDSPKIKVAVKSR
jgi:hypothetical protein